MSSEVTVRLEQNQAVFHPNAIIKGLCQWKLPEGHNHHSGSVCLLWYTEGIGTQDIGIIATEDFEIGNRIGEYRFSFTLPESPISVSSSLISILWAVECVLGNEVIRAPLVSSAWDDELVLLFEDEQTTERDTAEDEEELNASS
jgi:hypothetical protein